MGHVVLIGASGAGKTVMSRFVAWHKGYTVFQIKAHRGYAQADFEADLRKVMTRSGCKGDTVCFIFDESNVLSSGFLELMNALLASGEVPGLFDGDEWPALMQQVRPLPSRSPHLYPSACTCVGGESCRRYSLFFSLCLLPLAPAWHLS